MAAFPCACHLRRPIKPPAGRAVQPALIKPQQENKMSESISSEAATNDQPEEHEFTWNHGWLSVRILVTFEPFRFTHCDYLQVHSIAPEAAPLPISETGYLSTYPFAGEVAQRGGPEEYTRFMLDQAANRPEWKKRFLQMSQLSLF